jgi:hypothetical protein
MNRILSITAVVLLSIVLFSCKKESFITSSDARLAFSQDSLKFDTVFTTTGSVTKSFKILNDNDQKIKLSQIKLMGGTSSAYKMNVNGVPTVQADNVEIAANDSIYVFVTVTVNPTAANLPFIISDSISVNYNGRQRFVQLQSFGQNAVFIRNGLILGNVTFTNTLPYVILGGLQVANTGSLTLNAGTRIYCHADAPILIDGTLTANGTKALPVVFAGDRIDDPYINYPAAWPGIYFRAGSSNNALKFTNIKNAYQAVNVLQPSVNANPKLTLSQCIIDNAYDGGLLCTNSSVAADNCLISNCGRNIATDYGGAYSFTHCTVAAYSTSFVLHKNPGVSLSNTNDANQTNPLSALLRNCIIYGDASFTESELQVVKQGATAFNVTLDHCLYRAAVDPANTTFNTCIKNQDPIFDSVDVSHRYFDFHYTKDAAAPGLNKGVATSLLKDLDDKNRSVGLPDLGAYEKQ